MQIDKNRHSSTINSMFVGRTTGQQHYCLLTVTLGTTLHPEWDTESNPSQGQERMKVLWHTHALKQTL